MIASHILFPFSLDTPSQTHTPEILHSTRSQHAAVRQSRTNPRRPPQYDSSTSRPAQKLRIRPTSHPLWKYEHHTTPVNIHHQRRGGRPRARAVRRLGSRESGVGKLGSRESGVGSRESRVGSQGSGVGTRESGVGSQGRESESGESADDSRCTWW